MMVRIIDIANDGTETERSVCDLHECFPNDSRDCNGTSEFLVALRELQSTGRYWAGGGASPLVLLKRVQP